VVDSITTPQPTDVRTRFTFDRNGEHQRLINESWECSAGTCSFVGDWHTHAELYPAPSSVPVLAVMCEDRRIDMHPSVGTRIRSVD
jgi:integrative and conjugative element protein (TIGR02256 family)